MNDCRCRLQIGQPAKRRNCRCTYFDSASGMAIATPWMLLTFTAGAVSPGFNLAAELLAQAAKPKEAARHTSCFVINSFPLLQFQFLAKPLADGPHAILKQAVCFPAAPRSEE